MEENTGLGSLVEPEYPRLIAEILHDLGWDGKVRGPQEGVQLVLGVSCLQVVVLAQAQVQVLHKFFCSVVCWSYFISHPDNSSLQDSKYRFENFAK